MSNDFFNASGTPSQGSSLVSPGVRSEFASIAAGFDKLPTLTGNAYKITYINASGSAMSAIGGNGLLKISTTGVPSVAVAGTDYISATTIVASSAAVPNDADLLPVIDSGTAKKISLTNFKAFLKTYFDTLYAALSGATFTGAVVVPAGTVGAPSLTTTGDTNTGMWFPAADTIAWSTGGIERLRVDANGSITGTVTAGTEAFKISSDTASVNSRHRLNTTSATSSVAYCLSNSNGGVNTQVSLVLGGGGSTSFYVNQSAAADSVSGTQSLSLFTDGTIAQVAVAPLGYGTGSGGTVTQATSRTTGVTLNKPTGAITLFTAAGSATATTFTVTNSLISATDTVVLSVKSATNVYIAFVTAVAAGSFNVTFWTTGGTASDAPVINFALMKGVAA